MKILFFIIFIKIVFPQKIRIGVTEWIGNSISVIASEKKFWKSLGIDAEIKVYKKIIDVYDDLDRGEIHIGHDMIGSILGRLNRNDYKILLNTNWSSGGDKIIIKQGIKLPLRKGSNIGVYSTSPAVLYYINLFMLESHMKFSDYKYKEVNPATLLNEFINNEYQIIVHYDPFALKAISKGGGKKVSTSDDYKGVIPEGWFTTAKLHKKISDETLNKLYLGWYKALLWSRKKEHSKEYASIINSKLFLSDKDYDFRVIRLMKNGVTFYCGDNFIQENEKGIYTYITYLRQFIHSEGLSEKFFKTSDIIKISFSKDVSDYIKTNSK